MAGMKSSEQLLRLIQLVPYLTRNPGASVTETAAAFETTPRRILADLEVIQFCGLPGGLTDDLFDVDIECAREDGEIYLSNADVLSRPMRLSVAQVASLMVALGALKELGSEAAASTLEKLRAACGQASSGIDVTLVAGDDHVRSLLGRACDEGRVTRIEHEAADGLVALDVEPARLRVVDGVTYLDAWSRRRDAWRSFRLDRIRAAEILAETAPPREGLDEATRDWFASTDRQVRVTVTSRGAWLPEYYPTASVREVPGGLSVELPVGSRRWLIALLLRLGKDVTAVDDDEIVREAGEQARTALRAYAD